MIEHDMGKPARYENQKREAADVDAKDLRKGN